MKTIILFVYLLGVIVLTFKMFPRPSEMWKLPNWMYAIFIIFWPISYMIIGYLSYERWRFMNVKVRKNED